LLRSDPERIAYKAYMGAYPRCKSARSAESSAHKLLRKAEIVAYIDKLDAKTYNSMEITADRVNLEKARLAFFDPRKLFHPSGAMKKIHELDDDTAAAISGFEVEIKKGGKEGDENVVSLVAKIKHERKGPILDQISKQLGMYEKDNEQKTQHPMGVPAEQLLAELKKHGKVMIVGPKQEALPAPGEGEDGSKD
jgi:phage terminase small subunit